MTSIQDKLVNNNYFQIWKQANAVKVFIAFNAHATSFDEVELPQGTTTQQFHPVALKVSARTSCEAIQIYLNGRSWVSTDYWPTDKCVNPQKLEEAIRTMKLRIEQKFPSLDGDKTTCLDAINLLEFWTTPLQDKGESQGFNSYHESEIATEFDSEEHRISWENGFLKAHYLKVKEFRNDIDYKDVIFHANAVIRKQSGL